jgi:hypothetical protein
MRIVVAVAACAYDVAGMVLVRGLGFRGWLRVQAGRWLCMLGVAAGLGGTLLVAQDAGTTTLHVYANLVQIPVLVLSPGREPMAPIAASRFGISLDDGPLFRATHVRMEGDDLISLSILLDVNGSDRHLLKKIDEAVAGLAPLSLRPQDHVSIYAMDCSLIRSLDDAPAEQARLKSAVDSLLQPWVNGGRREHKHGCPNRVKLWDALMFMSHQLYGLPGRRVILAVTDGSDKGSKHTWNELRGDAQARAVAIFGLRYLPEVPGQFKYLDDDSEGHFKAVCELSGGLVLTASELGLEKKLTLFATMLRGRYIVEFPRPFKGVAGPHNLAVKIDKSDAFIRSGGISVPLPDPKVMADPMTVPSDPSRTPELGKRRILTTPQ